LALASNKNPNSLSTSRFFSIDQALDSNTQLHRERITPHNTHSNNSIGTEIRRKLKP
jgi:hypothetical protein